MLSSFSVFSKSISHFLYVDLTLCLTVCCFWFLSSRCELCSSCNIICLTVTGTCWHGRPRHLTYLFWILSLERDCLDKWGLNKPVIGILVNGKWPSAHPCFWKADTGVEQCTAVDEGSSKTFVWGCKAFVSISMFPTKATRLIWQKQVNLYRSKSNPFLVLRNYN